MNYFVTKSAYIRKGDTNIGNYGGFSQSNNVTKGRKGVLRRVKSVDHGFWISFEDKGFDAELMSKKKSH